MVKMVLNFFAPVQIFWLDLAFLVYIKKVGKLHHSERIVAVGLGLVFVVSH